MSFDTPQLFWLLVLVVPLFLFMLMREKKRRTGVDFLVTSSTAEDRETARRKLLFCIRLADASFILFTVLLIIGLAGPRWNAQLVADQRRGLDLIFAFDISRSMEVRDCPPLSGQGENSSRLEQAKAIARELCLRMDGIRVGVTAGKGRGVLMVPLTYDNEAVLNFIDSLEPSFLTGTGTNLESLLDSAINGFRDNMGRRQGIVLFTDGEMLEGSLDAAINRARASDIAVSAIGIGSDNGAFVPVPVSVQTPNGVLLDENGLPVISSRNQEVLKNAADRTGGLYADGSRNDAASLIADYQKSVSDLTAAGFRREAIPQWHIFVLLAIACFIFSRIIGFQRKKAGLLKAILPGLVCVISLMTSSCSQVQGKLLVMEGNFYHSRQRYNEAIASYLKALDFDDVAPYAEYGLGLCYSVMDENEAALLRYEAAEKSLSNSKEHQELLYRIKLNTGIIHFEDGDFSGAADFFRQALETDGSRLDAKVNLELSLLALRPGQAGQTDQTEAPLSSETRPEGQGNQALFDYLRSKEQEQWKSGQAGDSGSGSLDY